MKIGDGYMCNIFHLNMHPTGNLYEIKSKYILSLNSSSLIRT